MGFTSWSSTPNVLASTSVGTTGLDPSRVLEATTTPGNWLLKAVMAITFFLPTLYWKWISPLGITNISPAFTTLEKNMPSVTTEPRRSLPLLTKTNSVAHGWDCGGFTQFGAKSTWFMEMPRVSRPGKLSWVHCQRLRLVLLCSLCLSLVLGQRWSHQTWHSSCFCMRSHCVTELNLELCYAEVSENVRIRAAQIKHDCKIDDQETLSCCHCCGKMKCYLFSLFICKHTYVLW